MTDETSLRERGGIRIRLLVCDRCASVWPTERDPEHGGSRQDGEPCAYRWSDGSVCGGTVWPFGRPVGHAAGRGWEDTREGAAGEMMRGLRGQKWREALGIAKGETVTLARVRARYRELAKVHHPDVGGDHKIMLTINEAYKHALAELGQR